ncbi:MAG: hypothetical protein FIA82_05710 [Melioribacter sp.]|nr:hypothetical protein [Melioribacter sp.]
MKTISDYIGETLRFFQPSVFKRFHELKANDVLIGSIQQKGFFGMLWSVTLQNKNWEIYKPSCWRTILEVREAGYEMPIASFKRDGLRSKGTLSLPKGESLKIVPHLFKGFCEITNEQGDSYMRIKLNKISWGDKAEITIEKRAEVIDKYPWIIMLAYIIILEQKQRAHSS